MNSGVLKLTISTPSQVCLDGVEAVSVRAEDASGSFGIRAGHANFVTQLTPSVVRWIGPDNVSHYCAVNGGVLLVSAGTTVSIACREAVADESLEGLEAVIHRRHADEGETVRRSRVEALRLHARAVRQILRYLRPHSASEGGGAVAGGEPFQ